MGTSLQVDRPHKLTEAQRIAALRIASGLSGVAIAEELGIADETVSRWRQLPAFREEIDAQLERHQEQAAERLLGLSTLALDVIKAVLENPETPPKERLSGAFKLLEMASRYSSKTTGEFQINVALSMF